MKAVLLAIVAAIISVLRNYERIRHRTVVRRDPAFSLSRLAGFAFQNWLDRATRRRTLACLPFNPYTVASVGRAPAVSISPGWGSLDLSAV